MVATAFATGILVALAALVAIRHWRTQRKPDFRLDPVPFPLITDMGRAPEALPTVAAPSPEPKPQWPGEAHQYQIVRYRDANYRIIDGRILFERLEDIKPAIRAERAAGHPGKLMRTLGGHRVAIVATWT